MKSEKDFDAKDKKEYSDVHCYISSDAVIIIAIIIGMCLWMNSCHNSGIELNKLTAKYITHKANAEEVVRYCNKIHGFPVIQENRNDCYQSYINKDKGKE